MAQLNHSLCEIDFLDQEKRRFLTFKSNVVFGSDTQSVTLESLKLQWLHVVRDY